MIEFLGEKRGEAGRAGWWKHYSCSVTPSQQPTISGKGEKIK